MPTLRIQLEDGSVRAVGSLLGQDLSGECFGQAIDLIVVETGLGHGENGGVVADEVQLAWQQVEKLDLLVWVVVSCGFLHLPFEKCGYYEGYHGKHDPSPHPLQRSLEDTTLGHQWVDDKVEKGHQENDHDGIDSLELVWLDGERSNSSVELESLGSPSASLLVEHGPEYGQGHEDQNDFAECFDIVDQLGRVLVVSVVDPVSSFWSTLPQSFHLVDHGQEYASHSLSDDVAGSVDFVVISSIERCSNQEKGDGDEHENGRNAERQRVTVSSEAFDVIPKYGR